MVGHNNWFKISTQYGVYAPTTPFTCKFDFDPSTVILDWDQASDLNAQCIANKYDNLYLSLSGGTDSEYVAKVLLRNKIPFTPVLMLHEYNISEAWYAYEFCRNNNLKLEVIDYRNKCTDIVAPSSGTKKLLTDCLKHSLAAKLYYSHSFVWHIIADWCKDKGGHVLHGCGDPFGDDKYHDPIGNLIEMNEHDFFLEICYADSHPGAFFTYTPSMWFSLIYNIDTTLSTAHAKSKLYKTLLRSKGSFYVNQDVVFNDPVLSRLHVKYDRSASTKIAIWDRQTLLNTLLTNSAN